MNFDEMYAKASAWSDHGSHADEFLPALVESLKHTDPKYPVLEIGHREGGSTLLIAWHLYQEGKRRPLVSVDADKDSDHWYKAFAANVFPFLVEWNVPFVYYILDQNEFTERYAPLYEFGFIYHDGAHIREKVVPDLERLALRLVKGGLMAADDIHIWTTWDAAPTFGLEKAHIETSDVHAHAGIDSNHIGFWRKV